MNFDFTHNQRQKSNVQISTCCNCWHRRKLKKYCNTIYQSLSYMIADIFELNNRDDYQSNQSFSLWKNNIYYNICQYLGSLIIHKGYLDIGIVSTEIAQKMNVQYRNKTYVPDVLSFQTNKFDNILNTFQYIKSNSKSLLNLDINNNHAICNWLTNKTKNKTETNYFFNNLFSNHNSFFFNKEISHLLTLLHETNSFKIGTISICCAKIKSNAVIFSSSEPEMSIISSATHITSKEISMIRKLFIHGTLHCFGFDHINDQEAEQMMKLENKMMFLNPLQQCLLHKKILCTL